MLLVAPLPHPAKKRASNHGRSGNPCDRAYRTYPGRRPPYGGAATRHCFCIRERSQFSRKQLLMLAHQFQNVAVGAKRRRLPHSIRFNEEGQVQFDPKGVNRPAWKEAIRI